MTTELPDNFDLKQYAQDYENWAYWQDEVTIENIQLYGRLGLLLNPSRCPLTGHFTEAGEALYLVAKI